MARSSSLCSTQVGDGHGIRSGWGNWCMETWVYRWTLYFLPASQPGKVRFAGSWTMWTFWSRAGSSNHWSWVLEDRTWDWVFGQDKFGSRNMIISVDGEDCLRSSSITIFVTSWDWPILNLDLPAKSLGYRWYFLEFSPWILWPYQPMR